MSSSRSTAIWVDGRGWELLRHWKVEDGSFRAVDTKGPAGVGDLLYVLPGLIDSHVHLGGNPQRVSRNNGLPSASRGELSQVLMNLRTAARSGITTLRDVGDLGPDWPVVLENIEERRRQGEVLPRVVTAGRLLTASGGHATAFGQLVDPRNGLDRSIAELVERGARFVKVLNDPIVFSLRALVDARTAADRLGVPVSVHTYTDRSARLAARASVASLEHPGRYSDTTLDLVRENGIRVTTTFVAALDTASDPIACAADDLFEEADLDLFRGWYRDCCRCLPTLVERGIPIVLGTDAGFPGTDFDALTREFAALSLLGIEAEAALYGATVEAAALLGESGRLGVIAAGAAADIAVYDRDPIKDLSALRKPIAVYIGGRCCYAGSADGGLAGGKPGW